MALDQPHAKFKKNFFSAASLKDGQMVSAYTLSVRGACYLLAVPFHLCLIGRPCMEQKLASL